MGPAHYVRSLLDLGEKIATVECASLVVRYLLASPQTAEESPFEVEELRDSVVPMAEQPFLSVVGTGVATGVPDQCRLQIALNCVADNPADALTMCAELASKAIAAIGEVELEQGDVQTVGISVQDFFDKREQRVAAKVGIYQLDVRLQPIVGVGSILEVLGTIAGDSLQVNGFQLSVRDPEPLRSEARRSAVRDATRKASELSQAAGIRLGSILTLEDDNARSWPGVARTMAFAASSSGQALPIEPGEVSAVSSVTITYAIDRRLGQRSSVAVAGTSRPFFET